MIRQRLGADAAPEWCAAKTASRYTFSRTFAHRANNIQTWADSPGKREEEMSRNLHAARNYMTPDGVMQSPGVF